MEINNARNPDCFLFHIFLKMYNSSTHLNTQSHWFRPIQTVIKFLKELLRT